MQFKHIVFLIIFITTSLLFSGCFLNSSEMLRVNENATEVATASADVIASPEATETTPFTAKFEIYTLGTRRIFSDSRYHQQSPAVYILSSNPSTVYVEKKGTTWADFFASLPMSLDAQCLITGTNQTFCSDQAHKLVFVLNGNEEPLALEKEIQAGDFLEVLYDTK